MFLNDLGPVERVLQTGMRNWEFYAFVISKMNRKIDRQIPAAGAVSLDHGDLEWVLTLNPDILNEIAQDIFKNTPSYQNIIYKPNEVDEDGVPFELKNRLLYAIMVHEFLHLTLNHIQRSIKYRSEYTPVGLNIAADFAINSMIRSSPHGESLRLLGALFPNQINFPDDKSMDQYLELLKNETDKDGKDGMPICLAGKGDQNGMGGDLSYATDSVGDTLVSTGVGDEEVASTKLKQRVRQTVKKLNKVGRKLQGVGSNELDFLVDWVAKNQKIDWARLLQVSLQGSPSFETTPTYSAPSKRSFSGTLSKGRKRLKKDRIMVLVDTSGSMGEADYNRVFGVLESLERVGTEVKVALWDYEKLAREPESLSVFKGAGKKAAFSGGGGTDMKAGVNYLCKYYSGDFEKILVITDGYTPYHFKKDPPTKPVIWLVTTSASFEDCSGTLIRLD